MLKKIQFLDGTTIKLALLVLMVLDHIYYIFGFTETFPGWFEQISVVVGPCFLFLMVEGFIHTHNQRKYYQKIWMVSALMGLFQWCMIYGKFGLRADEFRPFNGILANFLIVFVFLAGIQLIERKQIVKGALVIAFPIVWTALGYWISILLPDAEKSLFLLHAIVFPNALWIEDGTLLLLLPGILIYLLRKNRILQVVGAGLAFYLSAIFLIGGMYNWLYYQEVNFGAYAAEPTMIGYSLGFLPMLLYNGKRGRGMSQLFYYFYPIHVYVLCAIGGIVYEIMNPGNNQIAAVTLPMLTMALITGLVLAGKNYLSKEPSTSK